MLARFLEILPMAGSNGSDIALSLLTFFICIISNPPRRPSNFGQKLQNWPKLHPIEVQLMMVIELSGVQFGLKSQV